MIASQVKFISIAHLKKQPKLTNLLHRCPGLTWIKKPVRKGRFLAMAWKFRQSGQFLFANGEPFHHLGAATFESEHSEPADRTTSVILPGEWTCGSSLKWEGARPFKTLKANSSILNPDYQLKCFLEAVYEYITVHCHYLPLLITLSHSVIISMIWCKWTNK